MAAFLGLANKVHAALQVLAAELIPLKFGLLAWAASMSLSGQLTTPLRAATQQGTLAPKQLQPMLESSILVVRNAEVLHLIS